MVFDLPNGGLLASATAKTLAACTAFSLLFTLIELRRAEFKIVVTAPPTPFLMRSRKLPVPLLQLSLDGL